MCSEKYISLVPLVSLYERDMSTKNTNAPEDSSITELDETTYRIDHTGPGDLSTTLVLALAEVAGVDPDEFRLYTHVDPDALNALFEPSNDPPGEERGWVVFPVADHTVTIYSSGRIDISEPA